MDTAGRRLSSSSCRKGEVAMTGVEEVAGISSAVGGGAGGGAAAGISSVMSGLSGVLNTIGSGLSSLGTSALNTLGLGGTGGTTGLGTVLAPVAEVAPGTAGTTGLTTLGGTGTIAVPTVGLNTAGAGLTTLGGTSSIPLGTSGLTTLGGTGTVAIPTMTTGGGGFFSSLAGSGLLGQTAAELAKSGPEMSWPLAKAAITDTAATGAVYKTLRDSLKQAQPPGLASRPAPGVLEAPKFGFGR